MCIVCLPAVDLDEALFSYATVVSTPRKSADARTALVPSRDTKHWADGQVCLRAWAIVLLRAGPRVMPGNGAAQGCPDPTRVSARINVSTAAYPPSRELDQAWNTCAIAHSGR